MQTNKYIANAPVQMNQHQRIGMVNQGVRANLINFQGAPPSAPATVVKTDGETRIEKVKTWAGKWGPLVLIAVLVGAKKLQGETKPAPVVVNTRGKFGKK